MFFLYLAGAKEMKRLKVKEVSIDDCEDAQCRLTNLIIKKQIPIQKKCLE